MVMDLVGVSCSKLRKRLALKLLKKYPVSVIKGNYSEIFAMWEKEYTGSGVDAEQGLSEKCVRAAAAALAEKYRCTVLASGKTDIIAAPVPPVFLFASHSFLFLLVISSRCPDAGSDHHQQDRQNHDQHNRTEHSSSLP